MSITTKYGKVVAVIVPIKDNNPRLNIELHNDLGEKEVLISVEYDNSKDILQTVVFANPVIEDAPSHIIPFEHLV